MRTWACLIGLLVAGCSCGDDDGTPVEDAGTDGGGTDSGPPDAGMPDAGPTIPEWCGICRRDEDCGEGNLCLVLNDGERGCGRPCTAAADCETLPRFAECIEEVPGLPLQCRPTSMACTVTPPRTPCASDTDCIGRYDRCVDADGLGAVCTNECTVDADCPYDLHRCRDTAEGRVCVPDGRPPPEQCARRIELGEVMTCGAGGTCPAGMGCVGSDPGVCAAAMPLEGCGGGTERVSAGGTEWCLHSDCLCWASDPGSLLDDALTEIGKTRCDMHWPSELLDMFGASAHDPFRFSWTDRVVGYWPNGVTFAESWATDLDSAVDVGTPIASAIVWSAFRAELTLTTDPPPMPTDLGAELVALVTAAGGVPDTAAIESRVAALEPGLAPRVAPIVAALREAHLAREAALARVPGMRELLFDAGPSVYLDGFGTLELRRADVRGALRGDVDLGRMADAARRLAEAIVRADLAEISGIEITPLEVDTPIGRVAIYGGGDDTYAAAAWRETALLIELGGNDTYRFGAGANASVANGVAVVVDVAGADDYGYDAVADPFDEGPMGHVRLPSDGAGRIHPAAGATVGPFSLSTIGRQGSGRLGIGMLIDLGPEGDEYRSLRISQGYGSLGVGVLWDAGGDDLYHGEAGVQGAAGHGIGILVDRGGNDRYLAYHEGQGFGWSGGVGVLYDANGTDEYFSHPTDVLYWSPQDPGGSNSSFTQGAGFGRRADFAPDRIYMSGGLGMLRDRAGDDRYTTSIFGQGTGYWFGMGALVDGGGTDVYDGRWYVQGSAAHFAIAVMVEQGSGNDQYNPSGRRLATSVGVGHDFSIGWLVERGGSDVYLAPGLSTGGGNAGGTGLLADANGDDGYDVAGGISLGNASIEGPGDALRRMTGTIGIFLDGGGTDTYTRTPIGPVANDTTWRQTAHADPAENELGVGIDRASGRLGI